MMSTEHNQGELGGGQTSRGDGTSFGTSCAWCVLHVVVCVRAMYICYGVFRTVRVVAGVDVDLAETVTFGPVALLSHVSGVAVGGFALKSPAGPTEKEHFEAVGILPFAEASVHTDPRASG